MNETNTAPESRSSGKQNMEYALLSQVAHMYYDLNMLQPEIAAKLFFSRSKVSRMLKQARELGIVEIEVKRIVDRVPVLEKKLCAEFGLKEAIVVTSFENQSEEDAFEVLTDFAALYVAGSIKGACKVGMSNGRTINAVVRKLRRVHPCALEIVQLMGSASNTFAAEESRYLVDRMLEIYSGKGYFLNTPLYVEDAYAKEILMKDPSVREVFQHMKSCSLLLTGIGTISSFPTRTPQWYGCQTAEHISELRAQGAVGSICAQYYDLNGRLVRAEWNQKCLVMPLEDVKENPMTVGITSGEYKVKPVLGALRGGLLNVLITNAATASRVLEENGCLTEK